VQLKLPKFLQYDAESITQSLQWEHPTSPLIKEDRMSISQMKIILIYFFDIKIIFNFKFTRPNSRQILCVEILKLLFVAVSRKKLQLLASD